MNLNWTISANTVNEISDFEYINCLTDNKQELSELMQTELSENPGVNSKSRTYMSKKEEEDVEAVPLVCMFE